jgi:hypothetical protein
MGGSGGSAGREAEPSPPERPPVLAPAPPPRLPPELAPELPPDERIGAEVPELLPAIDSDWWMTVVLLLLNRAWRAARESEEIICESAARACLTWSSACSSTA